MRIFSKSCNARCRLGKWPTGPAKRCPCEIAPHMRPNLTPEGGLAGAVHPPESKCTSFTWRKTRMSKRCWCPTFQENLARNGSSATGATMEVGLSLLRCHYVAKRRCTFRCCAERQGATGTGTHHITGAILNIATCQTHGRLKRPQQKKKRMGKEANKRRCGNGCEADEWQVLQEKEK